MRNLILSGGIFHPFAETSAAVAGHLQDLGVRSEIAGVAEGLARLRSERFDLVTVNALAWTMTQADKYDPFRDEFAFSPSVSDRAALTSHIDHGGGLLGLHTAPICFDTWPEWGEMLGAAWVWGRSHHPPLGDVSVEAGEDSFEIRDELYCSLSIAEGAEVLATARIDGVDEAQPVLIGSDRSTYLSLGHDLTATSNPGYQHLLHRAARRALPS